MTKNTVDRDVLAGLASKNLTQEKLILAVKAQLGQGHNCNKETETTAVNVVKEAAGSEM